MANNLLDMLLGQQMQSVSPDATQYGMNLPLIEEEVEYDIPETAHSFIDNELSMSEMPSQLEGQGLGLLEWAGFGAPSKIKNVLKSGDLIDPSRTKRINQMLKMLRTDKKRLRNLNIGTKSTDLPSKMAASKMQFDKEAQLELGDLLTNALIDFRRSKNMYNVAPKTEAALSELMKLINK